MQNLFIRPFEALFPYIRQYIYIRADGSTDVMTPPEGDHHFVDGLHVEKVLPHSGHLLFVRGAEVRYGDVENHADCIYIGGPHRVTRDLVTLHGWFEALMVEFLPGGMRSLLGYDMSLLKDRILTTDMLADELLHQVGLQVAKLGTATEAAALLDSFFLTRLNPDYARNEVVIARVINALDESCASLSVAEMASIACMSDRQFRRVFSEYVGFTPKEFIRIERFHLTLRYMQMLAHHPKTAGQPIDLMSVVVRYGYYDLSHLATEFRALGCTTPNQFHRLGIPIQTDFSIFFA